jgi:hypothetical protein
MPMTEWLALLILVPAIVAPAVLLFGFAGCAYYPGAAPAQVPIIVSANGKSTSVITLTWMIDPTATAIEFERTQIGQQVNPPQTFDLSPAPATHDDPGLLPATTYSYRARAIYGQGAAISDWSASVLGTTLATAVTFDAAGHGGSNTGTNTATATWSHTAVGGPNAAVVVGLRWTDNIGFGTPTRTVTYGGTPMASLGVIGLNNAALTAPIGGYQEFFGLLDPPAGVQTVSVTVSRNAALSVAVTASSVSYLEVSAFGPAASVAGSGAGTSLSQTVSSAVNEMVVQMFGASGAIGSYNETVRFNDEANGFVIGDAPGAASVSFAATRAAGVDYAGSALRLTPV